MHYYAICVLLEVGKATSPTTNEDKTMADIHNERVEHWDDERDIDNGIIVTLRYGWSFEPCEHSGVKGFDTTREANSAIRSATRCECIECSKNPYYVRRLINRG